MNVGDIFWMVVPNANEKNSRCWWPKWSKPSPIYLSCHQNITSPTSVTNIDVTQFKYGRLSILQSSISVYSFVLYFSLPEEILNNFLDINGPSVFLARAVDLRRMSTSWNIKILVSAMRLLLCIPGGRLRILWGRERGFQRSGTARTSTSWGALLSGTKLNSGRPMTIRYLIRNNIHFMILSW